MKIYLSLVFLIYAFIFSSLSCEKSKTLVSVKSVDSLDCTTNNTQLKTNFTKKIKPLSLGNNALVLNFEPTCYKGQYYLLINPKIDFDIINSILQNEPFASAFGFYYRNNYDNENHNRVSYTIPISDCKKYKGVQIVDETFAKYLDKVPSAKSDPKIPVKLGSEGIIRIAMLFGNDPLKEIGIIERYYWGL